MQIPGYARDFCTLYEEYCRRGVAIQTIKSIACRLWQSSPQGNTWYEPLQAQEDISCAVHWVLTRLNIVSNSAEDLDLLSKVLLATTTFARGNCQEKNDMKKMVLRLGMEPIFLPAFKEDL